MTRRDHAATVKTTTVATLTVIVVLGLLGGIGWVVVSGYQSQHQRAEELRASEAKYAVSRAVYDADVESHKRALAQRLADQKQQRDDSSAASAKVDIMVQTAWTEIGVLTRERAQLIHDGKQASAAFPVCETLGGLKSCLSTATPASRVDLLLNARLDTMAADIRAMADQRHLVLEAPAP